MSGFLDNCSCRALCACSTCCEELWDKIDEIDWSTKRNFFASVAAGLLFFIGWWFAIDMAATESTNKAYFVAGVGSTIAFFMVNAISASHIENDMYQEGCLSGRCARLWLFCGFLITFACLVGSAGIFWIEMVKAGKSSGGPAATTLMPITTFNATNTSTNLQLLTFTSPVSVSTATTGPTSSSSPPTHSPSHFQEVWPGTSILLQNVFIFIASMVFKFGRSEEFY